MPPAVARRLSPGIAAPAGSNHISQGHQRMRRAIRVVALVLAGAALPAVGAMAQGPGANRVNAIGFIDYASPPTFKPGDWVRYRVTGESELGMRDDYDLTILIAGQEIFWGDSCFWVETWSEPRKGPPIAIATCMSYSIFRDTLAVQRLQLYQRKQISEIDEQGRPREVVMEPAPSILKARNLFKTPLMWDIDTLGTDTVSTPVGEFLGRKVSIRQGTSATRTVGDSSRYDEVRENRVMWMDPRVPITHVARESVENIVARRSWMIGRSGEGSPLQLRERGVGSARLIGMGSGQEPRILPAGRRFAAATPARPATRAVRPAGGAKRR